jgi:hypothetical protein
VLVGNYFVTRLPRPTSSVLLLLFQITLVWTVAAALFALLRGSVATGVGGSFVFYCMTCVLSLMRINRSLDANDPGAAGPRFIDWVGSVSPRHALVSAIPLLWMAGGVLAIVLADTDPVVTLVYGVGALCLGAAVAGYILRTLVRQAWQVQEGSVE